MKKWQILLSSLFLTALIVPLGFGIYFGIEQFFSPYGYALKHALMVFTVFFMSQFIAFIIAAVPTCIAYYLLAPHIPLKMKFIAYPVLGFGIAALSCGIFCSIEPAVGYDDILLGIMPLSIPYVLLFSLFLIGFETRYIQRLFSRKDKQ